MPVRPSFILAAVLLVLAPGARPVSARTSTDLLSPGRLLAQGRYQDERMLNDEPAPRPRRRERRGSGDYQAADALLGLGVIVVPGGPFLLWTDPDLDSPYVKPIPGVVLFMVSAAFGLRAYVGGHIAQGVGIQLGAMAAGFGGFYYALPKGSESASAPPAAVLSWTARF